jgi:RES domain-containing protein
MPIIPGLIATVRAGQPYYRITSTRLRTPSTREHKKVVDGGGAVLSSSGGRYHYPGARAVYLAEDPATCFAERLYYFHRDVLTGLDTYHITGRFPAFQETAVLWEILFRKDIPDVFELSLTNASAMGVYPSLMLNPSQDYKHLKDRRAAIQSNGYQGLRSPSSRVRGTGHMVVLFQDQSKNVQSITPHEVEFRLVTSDTPPAPFTNHATDLLDFAAGEVRVIPSPNPHPPHPSLDAYRDWTTVEFNH